MRTAVTMRCCLRLAALVLGGVGVCALSSCFLFKSAGADYLKDVGGRVPPIRDGGPYHPPPAVNDDVSYWEGDGVAGSALVRIDRTRQLASFYKGGVLVGVSAISTGDGENSTPVGRFRISEKDEDHKSSVYGHLRDTATGKVVQYNVDLRKIKLAPGVVFEGAAMPYFMRFAGGVGMHTGYLPGYAASHGCVRMPHRMAKKFFENVEVGTPVIVE